MTCAVIEHRNGTKTHHSNVLEGGLSLTRGKTVVKLKLVDSSIALIESGVAVKIVDDLWLTNNSKFNETVMTVARNE